MVENSQVSDDEKLARFIFSEDHFNISQQRVKQAAFLPHPLDKPELSVFRINNLSEIEIWQMGEREVASKRGRPIRARGDFIAKLCREIDLDILPHEPPPRHAEVTGWKPSDKDAQKAKALELAAKSNLVLIQI